MIPRLDSYEAIDAHDMAQQMADDDMWTAYTDELEKHSVHKPIHINLAALFDPNATEGVKP